MSKIISPPQSGRVGPVVYVNGRYGLVVRQYVCPRNPRTPIQQATRNGFGQVSTRWRALAPEKRIAWCIAAADSYTISRAGRRVALNGYNYFIRVNAARAHLGLSQYLLPAPVDGWSDITALYVARYGVPVVGTAVFIRTCQHIDGWTDLPKVASAFVPAA